MMSSILLVMLVGPSKAIKVPRQGPACSSADIFFVAHPDDDLLFQSPSLLHSLRASSNAATGSQHCSTTVYLTAGDAGLDWKRGYPMQREYGVRAAYGTMVDANNQDPSAASTGRQIFYTLPDGNSDGGGYPMHNHTSLRKLYEGAIDQVVSITGSGRAWTLKDVKEAVLGHLRNAGPQAELTVHLQDWEKPDELVGPNGEHSDHVVGAKIVRDVLVEHAEEFGGLTVVRHLGYETQWRAANVVGDDLEAKADAFYAYAKYDEQLSCRDKQHCIDVNDVYWIWVQRDYKYSCGVADLAKNLSCGSDQ